MSNAGMRDREVIKKLANKIGSRGKIGELVGGISRQAVCQWEDRDRVGFPHRFKVWRLAQEHGIELPVDWLEAA